MRIPLPQVLAGVLVARQASVLPSDFCSPECPSCKDDIINFTSETSCTADSSFITNCGHCQTCVMTYAIENGGLESQSALEQAMINFLNWCDNTTIAGEIQALQSQASVMSVLGAELATTTDPALASMTGSLTMAITSPPSTTGSGSYTGELAWKTMSGGSDNPAWKSMLSTATWASAYYSHQSAEAQRTGTATPKPSQSGTPTPLNPTWIAGPVVGSVMGICTVLTAIFFTRRRQRKEEQREMERMVETIVKKEFHDNDLDNDSALPSPRPPEKAQLHSESRPTTMAREMDNTQVYELPASEPVGSELSTPIGVRMREADWPLTPLPLSPVALLFAESELRDQRRGDRSPLHNTFYHP